MNRWIIGIIVLLVAGALAYFTLGQGGGETATAPTPTPLGTLPPVSASDRVVAEAEVVPIRDVELRFESGGTVAEVLVSEGDQVRRNDALARLDTRDLELSIEEAAARLAQARADYELLLEGATPDEVAAAQAQIANAEAALAQTQAQAMQREAAISKSQAEVARATGQFQSTRGRVTDADIAAAQARVEEARVALAKLEAGPETVDVATAQAAVDQQRAALQDTRDSLSAAKTQAELDLQKAAEAVRKAQVDYSNAYWNWQYVRDHGSAPPETAAAPQPQLSDQSEQGYRDQLNKAEIALREAEKNVEDRRVALENARQAEITGVQEVEARLDDAQARLDDVLLGADDDELASARATLAQAEADLAQLVGEQRAGDIASAQAAIESAQADVTAAQADLEGAFANTQAAQAELERRQAELDNLTAAPRKPEVDQKEAVILQEEVRLKQTERELEKATLLAPMSGTVVEVDLEVGERIEMTQVVIRIADFSEWEIETTDLTELGVVRVQVGDPVEITFDALPGVTLQGSVKSIQDIGKNAQGDIVYKVTVTPEEWDERLRWGMTATVSIEPSSDDEEEQE